MYDEILCRNAHSTTRKNGRKKDIQSSNLVTFHHEVASTPPDKVSRECCSVSADELPTFSKGNDSTVVLSGTRHGLEKCLEKYYMTHRVLIPWKHSFHANQVIETGTPQ